MTKDKITGKFNLNKKLLDGRRSPKNYIVPEDKDVLILDQHTEETPNGDLVNYTKVVGVAENVNVEDGVLNFDWKVTDPGLLNLINSAKHPEKLFKYSPEHMAIDVDEEYEQGRTGMLEHIAITNKANDNEAITTRIFNWVMDAVRSGVNNSDNSIDTKGDIMDEEMKGKIQDMIKESTDAFDKRLEVVDKISESLEKMDFEKIGKLVEKLPELEKVIVKTGDLEKNIAQFTKGDDAEREILVKNVKTNAGLSDETLEKMSISDLKKLDEKFTKNTPGVGENGEPIGKTIVDEINEMYGTDIGKSLREGEQ